MFKLKFQKQKIQPQSIRLILQISIQKWLRIFDNVQKLKRKGIPNERKISERIEAGNQQGFGYVE